MEIRILGSLEFVDDYARPVPVPGTRLQALLIALALRCGEVVTDDRLFEIVWGDDVPERSTNALQRHVSTLRRLLGRPDRVVRRGGGYSLTADRGAVDVFQFEELVRRGREAMRDGQPGRASELFAEGLALWRGDALSDVAYHQFAQSEIARLTEMRIATTEARLDADLALGRHAAVVGELERLVSEHPLREHLHARLMLALARSGRQAEALRAFQAARAILGEELGISPSPELCELEAAILRQDEHTVHREVESSARPRTNLRTPLTSLVGRADALAGLSRLLRSQRLVTLVGPGGVGKTRLAIDAAKECLDSGAGDRSEAWLVELADVADPRGVVCAIAAALDLPRSSDPDIDLMRIVEFLQQRRALILLDNCEHLLGGVATIVHDLLEVCPGVQILATSREGLGVPSEVLWRVLPLSLDDAVALFVERGLAAAPASGLGDDAPRDRDVLHAICAKLDGLPLAVELAAARLRGMPMSELARGLADRFRVLSRGPRTARPRQQTLRAVVDWSYELLFDDERRVFERLSVFTGGCSVAAARVVCADDEIGADDVAELLTRLADKSLLTLEEDAMGGYSRCRMLQTLVDYGRERLAESGDAPRTRDAHARYYTDFARRSHAALRGERQRGWLRAVAANLGNLRFVFDAAVAANDAETAQSIAGSLGWFWWFTGRSPEGAGWLSLAAGCDAPAGEITRARLLAWTAFTSAPGYVLWSDADEALAPGLHAPGGEVVRLGEEALSRYREHGVTDELVGVEMALAVTLSARGDHVRARDLLADAEQILRDLAPEPRMEAVLAFVVGRRAFVENRFGEAEAAFRAAVTRFETLGAEVYLSFAYRYLGRLRALASDHEASIEAIETALCLARDLGLTAFVNVLLTDLGEAVAAAGDYGRAREILELPLAAARDRRFLPGVGKSLAALALLEWRAGNREPAAQLSRQALEMAELDGDIEAMAHCLGVLGRAAEWRGDAEEARAWHAEVLGLSGGGAAPRWTALALEGLAAVAMLEDDGCGAARLLGAAGVLRRSPGQATGWAFGMRNCGNAEAILARATVAIGGEAVAVAAAEGAADPRGTVERVSVGAVVGSRASA